MNDLDRMVDGVGANTTIHGSADQLLHNIAGAVRRAAGNQEASTSLADMIDRETTFLGKTMMANTPMIVGTPQFHPAPDASGGERDTLDVTSMTASQENIAKWQSENAGVREIERVLNDDGTVTVYFRPVHDKKAEDEAAAAFAKKKKPEAV